MNDLKIQLQGEITAALDSGISQNRLAEMIGISPATIINVRRGEWKSVSESMLMNLRGYFKINDWKVYETANLKAITELCDDASTNKRFLAIAGYTGSGKTTALTRYAKKHVNTWYILGTTIMTQKSFLNAILRAMGISDGTSIADKMAIIVRELNNKQDSLIIVDDAGKLSDNILRLIQIIYDETEDNAGIIMAGTESLETNINRGAMADRRGFRELQRRIAYWQPMRRPSKSEVVYLCSQYGINDTPAINYVMDYKDFGTIRNLITNAVLMSNKMNASITRSMLEDLKVGSHHYKAQYV
jgi:transcriptional regulator with XRE-family HTH domain